MRATASEIGDLQAPGSNMCMAFPLVGQQPGVINTILRTVEGVKKA